MKKVIALLTIISTCSLSAFAHEPSKDNVLINKPSINHWEGFIDTFTKCDTSFFSEVYNNKEALNQLTTVKEFGDKQAYIPVTDRTDNNNNYHYFKAPIPYKNLNITGYYDSVMNLGKHGDYYFWGFIFEESIEKITKTFAHLNWQNMENGQLYIAHPLIRTSKDNLNEWHANTGTIVGVKTIPAKGTTEKLLLLEKGPMTSLLCSIQGFVPTELLNLERPDIQSRPK